MAKPNPEDMSVLMDYVLNRCPEQDRLQIQQRLAADPDLRAAEQDLRNASAALRMLPDATPPQNLVQDTLARIRQQAQLKKLLARQEAARRPVGPAFSLRELGALAAAALVLLAIAVPSLRMARRGSQAQECAANVGGIGTGMLAYAKDYGGVLPPARTAGINWLTLKNTPATSNSQALFTLVQNEYAPAGVFLCPAVGGEPVVAAAGMVDFPAEKHVSYSYQHSLGTNVPRMNEPALWGQERSMAILADSNPVFTNGLFHRDQLQAAASRNHDGTGQNVLYLDGHVQWSAQANVGVNGDNIFLADGIREYQGIETPHSPTDSFLLPAYSPSGGR